MSHTREAGLAPAAKRVRFAPMVFTEIKEPMEPLPHDAMVKAPAFLRRRLRADSAANREELAQRHAKTDAGKVRWADPKRQWGLSRRAG
jgi:hypothetical protein